MELPPLQRGGPGWGWGHKPRSYVQLSTGTPSPHPPPDLPLKGKEHPSERSALSEIERHRRHMDGSAPAAGLSGFENGWDSHDSTLEREGERTGAKAGTLAAQNL